MNDQEKIEHLKAHLLILKYWFREASISDDESEYQIEMIDQILAEIEG